MTTVYNPDQKRKKRIATSVTAWLGTMAYDEGPTFRKQVATTDEISLEKIKNEYKLIVEKKSRLSARQRALIIYKVQEYKKLGIV